MKMMAFYRLIFMWSHVPQFQQPISFLFVGSENKKGIELENILFFHH